MTFIDENTDLEKDEDDEEASEEDEEPPVKIRKIERTSGRKSTKKVFESDDSDDEALSKIDNRKSSNSRRSSARPSRKNSPEVEENVRGRRSSKKFTVEETAAERRASKRSFDAFNTISLSTLIDEVIKHKNAWPFTKPVSISEVPDYLEVIKTPMDFSKIKSKLNLGYYSSNEQAMKDVELVFFNCDLYNVANSEIYK